MIYSENVLMIVKGKMWHYNGKVLIDNVDVDEVLRLFYAMMLLNKI